MFTVGSTVDGFFELYPEKKILMAGSTESRTRLYRMMFSRNMNKWANEFEILGLIDETFHTFEKDVKYDAFMITKKL